MALVTGSIEARYRGSFMSLNSSLQQFTSGGVAYLGGLIIGKSTTGEMTHFPLVGGAATACAVLSICLVRSIKIPVAETPDAKREALCAVRGPLWDQTKVGKRL